MRPGWKGRRDPWGLREAAPFRWSYLVFTYLIPLLPLISIARREADRLR